MQKTAKSGGDPVEVRRAQTRVVPIFQEAAETLYKELLPSWKNAKHGQQWLNTLTTYVFPEIGKKRVDQIGTPDVLRVLSPIWLSKPETASRVRQRIKSVLDWAKAAGFRSGDNAVEGVELGLPKQATADSHFASLPYTQTSTFIQALRSTKATETTRLAFEFLILTATRTSEVLLAKWAEFNLDDRCWTIPAERMKAGREHRVPLSERCISILRKAQELDAGSSFVFPGRSSGKPLSNMAFLQILRRMECNFTAHGFRSTFRDWASEETSHPNEICEMALAHAITNKTEAAYRRGDLFERRRQLMADWAAYACTPPSNANLEMATQQDVPSE